ncbi:MAG: hypothetical protein HC913_11380 [Microscillaceae bacterium]|nr:hypothetical protein [Microscillaceae bacterium]
MALPVWGKFFEKLYRDPELRAKYPKEAFEKPDEINIELDCSKMELERKRLLEGREVLF